MAKVYTRTGDKGETSLVSGNRVSKSDVRIDLYGEVDELNSLIGLLQCKLEESSIKEILSLVQNELFNLGSNLACEEQNRSKFKLPQVNQSTIKKLEDQIDQFEKELPKLKNFILPGGGEPAALAHVCRTISRRVERKAVHFASEEELPSLTIPLLNRLSDYFFVLSRYLNFKQGHPEILWKF